MDFTSILKAVESFGSLGIIAVIIWKGPEIIRAISASVSEVVNNIIRIQAEQAIAYSKAVEMMIQRFDARFLELKEDMTKLINVMERQVGTNQLIIERIHDNEDKILVQDKRLKAQEVEIAKMEAKNG